MPFVPFAKGHNSKKGKGTLKQVPESAANKSNDSQKIDLGPSSNFKKKKGMK